MADETKDTPEAPKLSVAPKDSIVNARLKALEDRLKLTDMLYDKVLELEAKIASFNLRSPHKV